MKLEKNWEYDEIHKQTKNINIQNEKPNDSCYNTIDLMNKGDRIILITDSETLKIYGNDVKCKWMYSTIAFTFLLFLQLTAHSYISYYNLQECENKINTLNNSGLGKDSSKDITYICASYLMHIFLMVGYFFIAFVTTYKQSRICFQIFEIYLMIMFISDMFFSFLNP
jgi:hypothetical protein